MGRQKRTIPEPSDTLGNILHRMRLNGLMYAQSELRAPWGMAMPSMSGKMMFHLVLQGKCWLTLPNQEAVCLQSGELILLPKGEGHGIASAPSVDCTPFFDLPMTQLSDRFEYIRYGHGGEETLLTCGVISFDHFVGKTLIAQLPTVIHIRGNHHPLTEYLEVLISLMAEEAKALSLGGETIIANLADIIVIHAIRHWINHSSEAHQGWVSALRDSKIGKALSVIHAHPEKNWTVNRLAEEAGMSRSGFSAKFTELMGTSVKQYVTEWRMNLARIKIMQSPVALIDLAEELGYASESAFSRAYKRVFGVPPLRKNHG